MREAPQASMYIVQHHSAIDRGHSLDAAAHRTASQTSWDTTPSPPCPMGMARHALVFASVVRHATCPDEARISCVCVRAAEGDACSQTTAHTPCTQKGARRDALEICAHGVMTRAEMPCHSHSMDKQAAHAARACADGDASFHDLQTHGHRQGMWGDDTAAYAAEDASMLQTTS